MSASSGLDWPWSSREGSGTKLDFTRIKKRRILECREKKVLMLPSHVRMIEFAR